MEGFASEMLTPVLGGHCCVSPRSHEGHGEGRGTLSVLGGGRYSFLLQVVGFPSLPQIGFYVRDVRFANRDASKMLTREFFAGARELWLRRGK
jgi:hypothetical protein